MTARAFILGWFVGLLLAVWAIRRARRDTTLIGDWRERGRR